MKWSDILAAAMTNLLRRKLRSALTMLGVVIGTAAIVVTISLGNGAEQAQMQMLEETTNLRLIQVYPFYSYGSSSSSGSTQRITKITDNVLNRFRHVKGVNAVTPVVNVWASLEFILTTGKYHLTTMLTAVSPKDFARIVELKSGKYFTGSTDRMEFILSEIIMAQFTDAKKDEDVEYIDVWSYLSENKDLPLPKIDWLKAPFDFTLRWEDYESVDENNPDPIVRTKEYKAKMIGTLAPDINDWTFGNGAIVNLSWLKRLYRDNKALFKEVGVTDISSYDTVYIQAKTTDDVESIVKDLTEMGVQCSSPLEMVRTYKEQIQTVQGFLGFIGAISMLVAALSIANTMMMSIYERTREIGVMKVLGCKLNNIRMIFLSEAAYIGVFGGGFGLITSYALSYALNHVEWLQTMVASVMSSTSLFSAEASSTSVITSQLALGTWGFVILISLMSGVYPAQRAMGLSSLAAIRNSD